MHYYYYLLYHVKTNETIIYNDEGVKFYSNNLNQLYIIGINKNFLYLL